VAEKMARFGVVPEMSFIVGNPPDPEGDLEKTLRFIRRLKRVNPHEIVFYLYSPCRVGDMLNEAVAAASNTGESRRLGASAWEQFAQHLSSKLPWMTDRVRRKVRNFQQVLHAAYPTITDPRLTGLGRFALRTVSAWRYAAEFYAFRSSCGSSQDLSISPPRNFRILTVNIARALDLKLNAFTHRLRRVPVVALMPHSRCNCRCIMCDIWKANREGKSLAESEVVGLLSDFRSLGVEWVLLSAANP